MNQTEVNRFNSSMTARERWISRGKHRKPLTYTPGPFAGSEIILIAVQTCWSRSSLKITFPTL